MDDFLLPKSSCSAVSLEQLPPLPLRKCAYYTEPFIGICVVGYFCWVLVDSVDYAASMPDMRVSRPELAFWIVFAIRLWACIAFGSLLYILFGGAGVVQRNERTVHPIPEEIAEKLIGQGFDSIAKRRYSPFALSEAEGRALQDKIGTREDGSNYCSRCFLWRPPATAFGDSHHCSICGRCVASFDHHCGCFGRCIVKDNMTCFVALPTMLAFGFCTAIAAMFASVRLA